ncbi:unnamed protein product [Citrullus colocynthis]|uniref:Uncharacterized protein n=1 Tax=Citrullus colocynthis TaxID=252529 RepID=A0ABP0ZAL8_9ROSI
MFQFSFSGLHLMFVLDNNKKNPFFSMMIVFKYEAQSIPESNHSIPLLTNAISLFSNTFSNKIATVFAKFTRRRVAQVAAGGTLLEHTIGKTHFI